MALSGNKVSGILVNLNSVPGRCCMAGSNESSILALKILFFLVISGCGSTRPASQGMRSATEAIFFPIGSIFSTISPLKLQY